jgi:hypothetical protein
VVSHAWDADGGGLLGRGAVGLVALRLELVFTLEPLS